MTPKMIISFSTYFSKTPYIVDVEGNIDLNNTNIEYLTNELFEFGKVDGIFSCTYCSSLTSLEGAPKKVGGNFNCRRYSGKYTEDDVKKYTELEGYVIA